MTKIIKKPTKQDLQRLNAPSKNNVPIISIVTIVAFGISAIVLILVLRPDSDPLVVVGAVGGLVTSVLFSVLAYLKGAETHDLVNSRMSIAIEDAVKAALGEGRKQGRREAENRTDKLAKIDKAAKVAAKK